MHKNMHFNDFDFCVSFTIAFDCDVISLSETGQISAIVHCLLNALSYYDAARYMQCVVQRFKAITVVHRRDTNRYDFANL